MAKIKKRVLYGVPACDVMRGKMNGGNVWAEPIIFFAAFLIFLSLVLRRCNELSFASREMEHSSAKVCTYLHRKSFFALQQ